MVRCLAPPPFCKAGCLHFGQWSILGRSHQQNHPDTFESSRECRVAADHETTWHCASHEFDPTRMSCRNLGSGTWSARRREMLHDVLAEGLHISCKAAHGAPMAYRSTTWFSVRASAMWLSRRLTMASCPRSEIIILCSAVYGNLRKCALRLEKMRLCARS